MNRLKKGALGAAMALASTSATAQDYSDVPGFLAGSEIAVGVLEHAANFHPLSGRMTLDMPTRRIGQIYGAEKENCTADVQFTYRSPPLHFFLKPRLTAKIRSAPAAAPTLPALARSGGRTRCMAGSTVRPASGSPFMTVIALLPNHTRAT